MVVPMDVLVDQGERLAAGSFLPLLGVDGLDLHPSEEALRGRAGRAAALVGGCGRFLGDNRSHSLALTVLYRTHPTQ